MPDHVLRDVDDLESALAQPRVLLFKHSPICPISQMARAEFEMFKMDYPDVPTLFVDVINSRPVVRAIAQQCGIEHESPQAILFEAGTATWHASDTAITKDALAAAWAPKC